MKPGDVLNHNDNKDVWKRSSKLKYLNQNIQFCYETKLTPGLT